MSLSTQRTRRTQRAILAGLIFVSFVSFVVDDVSAAATPRRRCTSPRWRASRLSAPRWRGRRCARDGRRDVRAVVAAYQEIVRLYPASGYSDNALWQAGRLSIDAFLRFGQERDRNTGDPPAAVARRRSTRRAAGVKEVPEQLARVDGRLAGEPEGRSAACRYRRAGTGLQPGPTVKLATIKEIRREVLPDAVRITIELDREVPFHDERIPDPVRVFVDLPVDARRTGARRQDAALRRRQRHRPPDPHRPSSERHDARRARCGRRVELQRLPAVRSVPPRHRLRQGAAAGVGARAGRRQRTGQVRSYERLRSAPADRASPAAVAPAGAAPMSAAAGSGPVRPPSRRRGRRRRPPSTTRCRPLTSTTAPPRNVGGGYSMARQLGLSVSRIVIDPGHGGHDPGAKGKSITEAELVLDIALRLEKLLQKVPGTEVILTRRTDEFVPLQERTAIANREGADLFLSIHANASANAAGARRRDLLPELRQQHDRGVGRRARKRRVRAGDGRAARFPQGHRAQQQAGRVARLRDRRAAARSSSACGSRTRP